MNRKLSKLFWLDTALAALCAALLLITVAIPDWIEETTGFEPDGGKGATEWALVAGLALASVILAGLAAKQWWRAERIA